MEVVSGISAIINLLDVSIDLFKNTQKDLQLSETFKVVRRQLPILRSTLDGCYQHLNLRNNPIPKDVAEALEKILDACEIKAKKLKRIFAKIIPDKSDPWQKQYAAIIQRLGKGNKVEELMRAITEDVQTIVNYDAVKSADSQQNMDLEKILEELKSLDSSVPGEDLPSMNFTSHGGPQHNYVHRGHGAYHVNSGSGKQYNAEHQSFVMEVEEDFSFREPAGHCLSRAPYIASELFVGRGKELKQISEMLRPLGIQEQQHLVLGGMGGIGKTQLAIAYAKSCYQTYDSVFWLNAKSKATLQDSFLLIAKQIFKLQQPDKLQAEAAVIHTCQWLSDTTNMRWLLIFDNYNNPDEFEIEKYFPFASHGVVLITTRQPNLVAGKKIQIHPIQGLEDSLMILQSRSKRETTGTDPHAKRLAERLAGLPLALATAGAFLQHSTITFECYLQEYEKHWNIDSCRPTRLEEYQDRTLFTTWDLSYTRVKEVDPDAAELLITTTCRS